MALPEFQATFRKLFPLIFNVAYRRLRDRQQAEDVAQDVFTIGYRKYINFKDQTLNDYRNYLWEICKNRCTRILGRVGREVAVDYPLPAPPTSPSPLSLSLRQICHTALEEEEYLILALYYVEDYNYEEIGDILGRSTTWVFTRVRSIKKKLRQALEKEDMHEAWSDETPATRRPGVNS